MASVCHFLGRAEARLARRLQVNDPVRRRYQGHCAGDLLGGDVFAQSLTDGLNNRRRPDSSLSRFALGCFRALSRNSNNALVAGSSGLPRSALSLLWVVSLAPKTVTAIARVFQHVPQTLCLRGCVRILGDMQDQERGNSFVLGNVGDGGEVLMLLGIVAEFFAVTKLGLAAGHGLDAAFRPSR